MKTKTEVPPMPSEEVQRQYWIDKDKSHDNVDWKALAISRYERMTELWHENDVLKDKAKAVLCWLAGDVQMRGGYSKHAENLFTELQKAIDTANLSQSDSTTVDPKPETDDLSRTEATCEWFDNQDRGDLQDDGRSGGYGESYGERNV